MLELVLVGLCWGVTNPFMRLANKGIEHIDTGSKWLNVWHEIRMVGTRLNYWIPFLVNQAGSVLYVWALQNISIVIAVPVANSLTYCFTAITGYFLGEKLPGRKIIIGTLLVCLGSSLIIFDSALMQNQSPHNTSTHTNTHNVSQ